jgi:hypothetical protein
MWQILSREEMSPDAQVAPWERSAMLLARRGFLILRPAYDRGWFFPELTDASREAVAIMRMSMD